METLLAEQPILHEENEQRKSFDAMASVRMMQHDLRQLGYVAPETQQRIRDEELSLLAEGMDRAARTTFVLQRQGQELMYYVRGEQRPYTGMLLTGKEVAATETRNDFRKKFLQDEAERDYIFGFKMQGLRPGEQLVWHNAYPYDVEALYGADFVQSCGRFPQRKMGFLYRASCDAEGNVILESQTVDRSNDGAFQAVHRAAQSNPGVSMDELVAAYDETLTAQTGNQYYAGRLGNERENVWQEMLAHTDLTEYFLAQLEVIARKEIDSISLEKATKRHMYGVWAAFKKRIDGDFLRQYTPQNQAHLPAVHYAFLEQEVRQSFKAFAAEGRVLVGCGGAIEMLLGEDSVLGAETLDVFSSIFGRGGEDNGPDGKGPLVFKCKNGHTNRRPIGKLIKACHVSGCKDSVGC